MKLRRRAVALLLGFVACLSGCTRATWDPAGYTGDGIAIDHGEGLGLTRYEIVLGEVDLGGPGETYEFEVAGAPSYSMMAYFIADDAEAAEAAHASNSFVSVHVYDPQRRLIRNVNGTLEQWGRHEHYLKPMRIDLGGLNLNGEGTYTIELIVRPWRARDRTLPVRFTLLGGPFFDAL